jgi:glucose-1-phosphate thymidylyltransferase
VSDPQRYGIVEVNRTGRITSIVEKPAAPKTNLAVAGIYKFDRAIWPLLRTLQPSPRGELEIPDAVRQLVESEYDVGAVELVFMADIGTHEDLQRIRNL